jgi:hypothetical protein
MQSNTAFIYMLNYSPADKLSGPLYSSIITESVCVFINYIKSTVLKLKNKPMHQICLFLGISVILMMMPR